MNNLILFAAGANVNTVDGGNGDLTGAVTGILSAIIAALGIVAVAVMIIGGYNYMTSSGDAGKVEKAKKTILYGLIGLIVCALAFIIVNFVIKTILDQGGGSSTNNNNNNSSQQTQNNSSNNNK